MLDPRLVELLACPQCKKDLEYDTGNNTLVCRHCKLKYPVRNDIPIMLIDQAEKFD
ncbi:Trm112 family protein [bacterium]|nr:Trm112 family protein [bacterium]